MMQTTFGLLTYLGQRLGAVSLAFLVLLVLASLVVLALAASAIGEILAVGTDPVQVAPVRWGRRL